MILLGVYDIVRDDMILKLPNLYVKVHREKEKQKRTICGMNFNLNVQSLIWKGVSIFILLLLHNTLPSVLWYQKLFLCYEMK